MSILKSNNNVDAETAKKLSEQGDAAINTFHERTKRDWLICNGREEQGTLEQRVDFYSENAEEWDIDQSAHDYNGPMQGGKLLHEVLKGWHDARILDVGCGTGLVMAELRKYGPYNTAVGLDAAPGMIERSKKLNRYVDYLQQYFYEDCGIAENSFDALVAVGMFLPNHLKVTSLREMLRVVKPGGFVVIIMRDAFLRCDPEISKLPDVIKQLVAEKKMEIVVDELFERYYAGMQGHRFAFKVMK